ncbi:putative clathrin assembly protein At5g57200 [Cynara cardunculus var. scolymus]|uniref:putative clathrin assembly protein At5g57200 n=1 Tax=Cynara cardunculus var. scolymus TaxID=59895 RepID=UPI000D6258DF|nr:putative clathrin assembly protein At5g57200 [Cynara cardunculus var. scolymus]
MGTFESFRKAFGALKDSTKVGLAKVNSEFKDLDIAIVKATNHVECLPKERHVRKIFSATCALAPRADVAYCIHALSKRLLKTRSWIVAIKTLIVFHRTLREGDPSFKEELLNYMHRSHVFQISNFKDDSSSLAWDCSAWVRTYAMFLQERLECFRMLKYDIESERLTKYAPGLGKAYSRTRLMSGEELLEQLPTMQQLLHRLIGCQPEGAAYYNYLVQYALALVLKESFKIYCAINDGIINLVDLFFDMPKPDAVKALNIYKKAGKQAEYLAEFYDFCRHLDLARSFQFPTLKQPPPSFLTTMEEYIREAPAVASVLMKRLEYEDIGEDDQQAGDDNSHESENNNEQVEDKEAVQAKPELEIVKDEHVPPVVVATNDHDILGLREINQKAAELDERNAMALAIVENGSHPQSSSIDWDEIKNTPGWELALVENNINTSNNTSQAQTCGGFDKFLLNSLYEDDAARRQIQLQNAGYNVGYRYDSRYNPFNQGPLPPPPHQLQDPFAMSNGVSPMMNVQMAMMQQQQQMTMNQQPPYQNQYQQLYHQQNMMVPYNNGYPMGTSNPFADVYEYPQSSTQPHGNHGLI